MKKNKALGLFILTFAISFGIVFVFLGASLICIKNYVKIDVVGWFWACIIISLVISVTVSALTLRSAKQIGETRFSFWVKKNYSKLLMGYFLLVFALASTKKEPIWTTEMVYDILSLQWTIFGLSLAIFLVWDVIIIDFLKKRQPQESDSTDLLQKYKSIMDKMSFSQEIETTFLTVILLTVNLFLLILSSSQIYIIGEPNTICTQNILHFSFFCTTNSIVILFLDMLKPLKEEKEKMLKNNNVTKEDIDSTQASVLAQAIIDGIAEAVMNLDSSICTEEEKKKILVAYMEAIIKSTGSKETQEDTPNADT